MDKKKLEDFFKSWLENDLEDLVFNVIHQLDEQGVLSRSFISGIAEMVAGLVGDEIDIILLGVENEPKSTE